MDHSCDAMFFCRRCGDMYCEHHPECACTEEDETPRQSRSCERVD